MAKLHIRSQSAIEFLALAGFVLFMFLVLLGITGNRVGELNEKKEKLYAEDIAIKVQKELNLAARSLDGYKRSFDIPQTIQKEPYTIEIENDKVSVDTDQYSFSRRIPHVTGDIKKGENKINRTDGRIYLN